MIVLYGIKNCDTCRKALKWLSGEGTPHRFHDVRKDGLSAETLDAWIADTGWEPLLNRRGTTWRNLVQEDRENLTAASARDLMLGHPTLIKRPVFDLGGLSVVVGFGAEQRARIQKSI